MAILRVLNHRGDDFVTWDPEKVALGDADAIAAADEAEQIFNEQRAKGAAAFVATPGKEARLDVFDPKVEEIVIAPPMVGG